MTTEELKEACMRKLRVVVRPPTKCSFRGHHIQAIVHKPDYESGRWKPCANIAYGEEEPYTIYHDIAAEHIYIDDNQESEGFTKFQAARERLAKLVEDEEKGESK